MRRVRLERAAACLRRQKDQSIGEIARLSGFSTAALFSRNFSKHFGMSPSQFRLERKIRQEPGKDGQTPGNLGQLPERVKRYFERKNGWQPGDFPELSATVHRLKPSPVAYFWHHMGYFQGVSESSMRLYRWAAARDWIGPDTRLLGIGYDNPDLTPPEKCRMWSA